MKNYLVKMTLAVCLLCVSLLPACGGNDGGGGTLSTGVPASKPVSNLTPAELAKLCAAVAEWSKDTTGKFACELSGTLAPASGNPKTDAEARMLCKDAVNECLQDLSTAPATTTSCMAAPASCKITVGEFEACLNDLGAVLEQLAASFPSCDSLSVNSPPVNPNKPPPVTTTPASCAVVQSKCPVMLPAGTTTAR